MHLTLAVLTILGCACHSVQAQDARQHQDGVKIPARSGSLLMDVSYPASGAPVPAVIVVHGGGWEAGDRRTYVGPLLSLLEESPYAWFSIDYRLAPAHPYPAAVEDVLDAVEWIHQNAAQFRVDPARMILAGESSGGHLVSLVGTTGRTPLAGVVSFYGIHNFVSWLGEDGQPRQNAAQFLSLQAEPLRDQEPLARAIVRQASPVSHVHGGMPPFLLIHGERDSGVPVSQSREMCAAIETHGRDCELFVLAGAGHGMESWERNPALGAWKPVLLNWLRKVVQR